jgi:hypothetical protein
MLSFNPVREIITGYLTSPENQQVMRDYVSSPEGRRQIKAYFASPEGQRMIRLLLPMAIDQTDVPAELKAKFLENLNGR